MSLRTHGLVVLSVLCMPVACESAAVNRQARTERAAVDAQAHALLREPTCDDGEKLEPDCGLITEQLATLRYRRAFRHKHCVGATADQCQHRYFDKVAAVLAARYPYADPAAVGRNCRKPDADCHNLVAYELVVLETHNAAVSRLAAARKDAIERSRRARQAAYSSSLQQALAAELELGSTAPECVPDAAPAVAVLAFCPP